MRSMFSSAPARLALAAALACGVAATPAVAAKKEAAPAAAKANYSKEFVALYQPLAKALEAGGDAAALKAQLPAVAAAAKTPDDKLAAGQLTYNVGVKANDKALQLSGADQMAASGKLDPASHAKILLASAQIAYQMQDWAGTVRRGQSALDAGNQEAGLLIAESYFAQKQAQPGLAVLDKLIASKTAANQPVPVEWLKRAIAMAYGANLYAPASTYAGQYALLYPSKDSWGDAIAILRNGYNYDGAELLDLMRLADRTGSLRNKRDYVDYISAADPRRLPGETMKIVNAGVASGMINASDPMVAEAKSLAAPRVASAAADMPALEKQARGASATPTVISAAADSYLSSGQPAKAEELYTLALAKPGVDTGRILTRIGIAQIDQGKIDAAKATFAKVQGNYAPIANLWSIYAQQKAGAKTGA